MTIALATELRKLVTTRLPFALTLLMVLVVGGLSGLMALTAHVAEGRGPIDLADPAALAPYYYAAPVTGSVFAVVLGAMSATSEHRHSTWPTTLVAEPRRWVVVVAKAAVHLVAGIALGVLATVVCVAAFAGTLSVLGHATHLGATSPGPYLGGIAAFALWAVLGVGLGTLVPNQAVVVVGVVVLTQFVEPVLRGLSSAVPVLETVSRALPGVATEALSGGRLFPSPVADSMGAGTGALVLVAFTVALVVAGSAAIQRREV